MKSNDYSGHSQLGLLFGAADSLKHFQGVQAVGDARHEMQCYLCQEMPKHVYALRALANVASRLGNLLVQFTPFESLNSCLALTDCQASHCELNLFATSRQKAAQTNPGSAHSSCCELNIVIMS